MGQGEEQQVQELLEEIGLLDERDFRPWSIALLVVLVALAGISAILLPRVGDVVLDGRYLPSLIYGLISIILLFNIYLLWQGRALRAARADLVRELLRADSAERLALTDPLTGVFNRRYLERVLANEIKRAERSGHPLSLMILDLDHFGEVNKKQGHLEGDRLLCDFAQFLLKVFRQTDTIVRYGGDEFLVLMPETDESQAHVARRRFLDRISYWNEKREEAATLTASVGIARVEDGAAVDSAIALADERLRQVKAGRAAEASVVGD